MQNIKIGFLSLLFLSALPIVSAHAQDTTPTEPAEQPTITIENAYAFATMPGSVTGAAFMVIKNTGTDYDHLVEVKSDVAKITEIHENMIDPDDGKMMMRKIKSITVPAGGEAVLEPTGKHIMLIKLPEPLTLDKTFPLTLVFEKSGEKIVPVNVILPGTKPGETTAEKPATSSVPKKIIPEPQAEPMPAHDHVHEHQHESSEAEEKPPLLDDAVSDEYRRLENSKDEITNY